MSQQYRQPMQLWPALAQYARVVALQDSGLKLHVYDAGPQTAQAVLLIHGLGDEADTWRYVIEPLAAQWRVIAPDLPGFGRSDKPRRAYTVPFLMNTLRSLLNALQVPRATVIGHSLGGILAHTLALTHPEYAERLVLVSGGITPRPQQVSLGMLLRLLPVYGEWSYNRLRRDPQAAYDTLRPYYANLDSMSEADRRFLFQRVNERVWSDGQRDAYLSVLRRLSGWMMRDGRTATQRLASVQTPTLIVWGEQDHIVPVENAHALTQAQPRATLALIPNAGHLPHQEQPEPFVQAVRSFMPQM